MDYYFLVPLQEDPVYRFRCEAGHERLMLLRQQRFELLAEVATQAIVDGYYREAVTSFASCLERFREYVIRVIAQHQNVSSDIFDRAWAMCARQSERQMGMFVLALTLQWQEPPAKLPDDIEGLRNKVVHKGYLPTREEAIGFGQAVIEHIQPILTRLNADCANAIKTLLDETELNAIRSAGSPAVKHTHAIRSLFEWHEHPYVGRNLIEELARR